MQENTPGRANVGDSAQLQAYYQRLDALDAGALWTVANDIEPWFPKSTSTATLWRYADLREPVLQALDLVTPEQAGRRVVMLTNPTRKDVSASVGWLYSGLQVMRPGEEASAHRHSASALRFIMEGEGAYTIVDGHKMPLNARDFVLTPNGTWHQHGVEAGGLPCIWQDGLDIPLVNALEAGFYEVHPQLAQASAHPADDTVLAFSGPGLLPQDFAWDKPYSPLLKYPWESTYAALRNYASVSAGSPFDGVILRYVNPVNGGDVMPTIGASMQLLRPGQHTRAHRHTGSVMVQVAKGRGYSVIGGRRFDWQEKDIFCVPSWEVHEHANLSDSEDACLFSFNDFPVMRALGLYREQAWSDNDGFQHITAGHPANQENT